jgi:hypothetical protein
MTKKKWQAARLQQQRLDACIADIVERGVAMQACYNTVCALEYLKSHDVGADVIERVLLHPLARRKAYG